MQQSGKRVIHLAASLSFTGRAGWWQTWRRRYAPRLPTSRSFSLSLSLSIITTTISTTTRRLAICPRPAPAFHSNPQCRSSIASATSPHHAPTRAFVPPAWPPSMPTARMASTGPAPCSLHHVIRTCPVPLLSRSPMTREANSTLKSPSTTRSRTTRRSYATSSRPRRAPRPLGSRSPSPTQSTDA